MNMMRKNGNRNNNNKHRSGGGGQRRYNNNSGGGNRSGANDSQNLQRQKHHATQQLGKYSDMARNAQINGDRVDVEYYLQHVDHYTRVLTDIAAIEAERYAHQRESQIIPGGPNDPNAQQNLQQNDGGNDTQGGESSGQSESHGGDQQAASGDSESSDGNSGSEAVQSQPRAPRPRQPRPDNGAREANSNTIDIPLPGSILPPI